MANAIFTDITEATAYGARERALNDLCALTQGEPEKAISLVAEYNELDEICNKFEDRKAAE